MLPHEYGRVDSEKQPGGRWKNPFAAPSAAARSSSLDYDAVELTELDHHDDEAEQKRGPARGDDVVANPMIHAAAAPASRGGALSKQRILFTIDDDDHGDDFLFGQDDDDPEGEGYGTARAALILVAECVGTGVLALPGVSATMGLGAFAALVLALVGLNCYAGALAMVVAEHAEEADKPLHETRPRARVRHIPELARRVCASDTPLDRWTRDLVYSSWVANLFLLLGQYLLVMSGGVRLLTGGGGGGGAFACTPASSVVGVVVVIALAQLPTMAALSSGPAQISVAATAVILALCLAARVEDDATGLAWTATATERSTGGFLAMATATSSVVFATGSQKLLLNVRAEMRDPRAMRRSLPAALVIFSALYVAVVALAGPNPPLFLLDALNEGGGWRRAARRAVGTMLVGHVAVSYAINQQALAATIMGWRPASTRTASSSSSSSSSWNNHHPSPRVVWFALTTALTLAAFLIANALPFFPQLVALIGACTSGPLTFGFPAALFALAAPNHHNHHHHRGLRLADKVGVAALVGLTAALFVFGTVGAVKQILHNWSTKPPFACESSSPSSS